MSGLDLNRFRSRGIGALLTAGQLEHLQELAAPRHWQKGVRFFQQGDMPTELFLLLEGRVSLISQRADGEQAVLDIIAEGDACPLANVVLAQALTYSGEALTAVKALAIPVSAFRQLLREEADLSQLVMRQLAQEWSVMADQNRALKLQNTNQRLAHFLLQHTDADDGAVEIRLLDERRLLARRLGMTPESLSRAIANLGQCGVEFAQQRVLIRNVDRLRQFCGLEVVS